VISKDKGGLLIEDSKKRKYMRYRKITRDERKKKVLAKIQKAISKK